MNAEDKEKKTKLVERVDQSLNYLRYVLTMLSGISEKSTIAALHNLDDTLDEAVKWAGAMEKTYGETGQ